MARPIAASLLAFVLTAFATAVEDTVETPKLKRDLVDPLVHDGPQGEKEDANAFRLRGKPHLAADTATSLVRAVEREILPLVHPDHREAFVAAHAVPVPAVQAVQDFLRDGGTRTQAIDLMDSLYELLRAKFTKDEDEDGERVIHVDLPTDAVVADQK